MSREEYIKSLAEGNTVTMRVCGNSMTPIMKTGDKIIVEPISSADDIKKGDAVFCHVAGMLTVHKVTGIKQENDAWFFQISNNHGHVNGWTPFHKVYGKYIGKAEKK